MLCTRCLQPLAAQHEKVSKIITGDCGLPTHIADVIISFTYPPHHPITAVVSSDVPQLQMSTACCSPIREPWLQSTTGQNGLQTTVARVCTQCVIEVLHHVQTTRRLSKKLAEDNEMHVHLDSSDFLYFKHETFVQPGSREICRWKSTVPASIDLALFPTQLDMGNLRRLQWLSDGGRSCAVDGQLKTRVCFLFKPKRRNQLGRT